MEKIQQLLALLQANPWASAAGIVILIWTVYENWDKIIAKLPKFVSSTPQPIPETDWPPFVPAELMVPPTQINERSLSTNERQQVFYYLERIRSYAESTKNTEASENCVDLLNNLFKEFYPGKVIPSQNVLDTAKGTK